MCDDELSQPRMTRMSADAGTTNIAVRECPHPAHIRPPRLRWSPTGYQLGDLEDEVSRVRGGDTLAQRKYVSHQSSVIGLLFTLAPRRSLCAPCVLCERDLPLLNLCP
jgi:hypothetical protein